MAYRSITRCLVVLITLLFITSCAAQGRLYNLCFTKHPQYTQYEYVAYDSFENPRNCTRYPDLWHQEFPVQVVAPVSAFNDVRDMAMDINDAVGKDLLIVRMRLPHETLIAPDDDAVVWVIVSDDLVSLCKKSGGKPCLAYTQYWFKNGKYYSTIVLYDNKMKTSEQRRSVVKHELLHALGLQHSKESLFDAMYSKFYPSTKPRRISQEDLKVLREL